MQYEGETKAIARLFHLDEKTQIELSRFAQVIQAATACMERVQCEKRYRQFLQLWEQTDEATAPEQSQSYFESLRQAQQRLLELDKQRQFTLADLI